MKYKFCIENETIKNIIELSYEIVYLSGNYYFIYTITFLYDFLALLLNHTK